MRNALKTAALLAALAAGTSGAGLAQTVSSCPTGYALSNGICQPAPARINSEPASAASMAPGYGSSSPPQAADRGPPGFGPTSYSYTMNKSPWPDGGTCAAGYATARFGTKVGCYPAH